MRRWKQCWLSASLALGLVWTTVPAEAQVLCTPADLNTTVNTQGDRIHGTGRFAQTFVAPGDVGECRLLNQITIQLCKFDSPPGGLVFDIYAANLPDLNTSPVPIGSQTIPHTDVTTTCGTGMNLSYSPVTVTFSTPPLLQAGALYTLVLRQAGDLGAGNAAYQAGLGNNNPYKPGQYCRWNGLSWDCPGGNADVPASLDIAMSLCTSATACPAGGCTYTQGYWKNHSSEWPVDTLTLGTVAYNQAQLLSILNEPVVGNGLISLAHQLIAAKLNVANGADDTAIIATITAADALIDGLVVPPVGDGYLDPSVTSPLTATFDSYNKGEIGPGHCEE
jgi:hypothetical protein